MIRAVKIFKRKKVGQTDLFRIIKSLPSVTLNELTMKVLLLNDQVVFLGAL